MLEIARIAEEMKAIYSEDAGYGPGLEAILRGISAEAATAERIPGTHSIWRLVLHIRVWEGVFRRRLQGEMLMEPDEGDFPVIGQTGESEWKAEVAALFAEHGRFVEALSGLPDSVLDQIVAGKKYTVRFMLQMAIQHVVYHSGQISLLKK